jgi:hypothetical protein
MNTAPKSMRCLSVLLVCCCAFIGCETPAGRSINTLEYPRAASDEKPILVAYETPVIAAIKHRWYGLLDNERYVGGQKGKVIVMCKLHSDGSITDVISKSTSIDSAHSLLCESAVKDPAPFPPWSEELRRKIKTEYREVTITFFYN